MKLFVDETVKCEVIKVGFLSRDLPLDSSAIMVKWKCLKLLNWLKGMRKIDSQLKKKKMIRLKYLILETTYTLFSIFNRYYIVLHTLNFLSPVFSGINSNNVSFFGFSNLSFFVFVFTTLKKKIFIFKYFLHWFNTVPSQSTLISQEVLCDNEINLGNSTNSNRSL